MIRPREHVDDWFARRFPFRHVLSAEIDTDLRDRIPLPVDVADKSFLGDVVVHAIGLSLCDEPPCRHLLNCLNHHRAATLLRMAGYQSVAMLDMDAWHRGDTSPELGRLFVAANRLAQIIALLNPRWGCGPTKPGVIARLVQRHPDVLHRDVTETRCEWLAFAALWNSYAAGFHVALRSYGTAAADVSLLGGRRRADYLLGATVLEVKRGPARPTGLPRPSHQADDHLRPARPSRRLHGHPRRRLRRPLTASTRYLVQPLFSRLADDEIDLTATAAELAEVIRRDNRRGDCWQHVG